MNRRDDMNTLPVWLSFASDDHGTNKQTCSRGRRSTLFFFFTTVPIGLHTVGPTVAKVQRTFYLVMISVSLFWEVSRPCGLPIFFSAYLFCHMLVQSTHRVAAGDHDLPHISIPSSLSVHLSLVQHLATLFVHLLAVFPWCVFLQSLHLARDYLVSLFSSHGRKKKTKNKPKKIAWCLSILLILLAILCQFLVTLFRLISLQSLRFGAFSAGTTFLLPPISFVTVLKLSRPRIHTSEHSTPGLLFLSE